MRLDVDWDNGTPRGVDTAASSRQPYSRRMYIGLPL